MATEIQVTLFRKLEPGMFPQLDSGKDVKFNNPPSVSGHAEFTTLEQKSIAAAYGITYEALTGDLSNTNFSSARMGWIEFSRNVDRWRWNMLIPAMKKMEGWFLEAAQLAGHDLSDVTLNGHPSSGNDRPDQGNRRTDQGHPWRPEVLARDSQGERLRSRQCCWMKSQRTTSDLMI